MATLFHHQNTSGETLRYNPNLTSTTSHPIATVTADNPSLNTLINRLEAATSRLEDIANTTGGGSAEGSVDHNFEAPNGLDMKSGAGGGAIAAGGTRSDPELPSSAAAGREASATSTVIPTLAQQQQKEDVPERVAAMDELISQYVTAFMEASKGIDPLVEEQAQSVAKAFADQRRFLLVSTKAKKPDPQSKTFMDLLTDLQHHMGSVGEIQESNRGSPMKEHLLMVGEGITALQWLVMESKPADYVGEVIGGTQMYGNRVLKAYKEGDQAHVKFVRSYYALLEALKSYIQKHFPSGVTWNSDGDVDPVRAYQDAEPGPTTTTGTNGVSSSGPPPPPPPPLPNFDNNNAPPPSSSASSARGVTASSAAGGGDMGSVFEQLNKGESVTSGLKKVDKSQMTHKNPSLRAGSTVPERSTTTATSPSSSTNDITRSRSPGPEVKPKPPSMRQNSSASTSTTQQTSSQQTKKEPKKELDGNKWLISNHTSPTSPIELDITLNQSILITNCVATTLILRGKANAISIDNSPKCQILLEGSLVSSIDVIKCPNFAVQVTGQVPTIMLDQVDGGSVYLGKEGLGVEVFTSKCSSVNVVLPPEGGEGEGGDSAEFPVPEQIRTVVKGGKLVSEIVEHAG